MLNAPSKAKPVLPPLIFPFVVFPWGPRVVRIYPFSFWLFFAIDPCSFLPRHHHPFFHVGLGARRINRRSVPELPPSLFREARVSPFFTGSRVFPPPAKVQLRLMLVFLSEPPLSGEGLRPLFFAAAVLINVPTKRFYYPSPFSERTGVTPPPQRASPPRDGLLLLLFFRRN